MTRPVWLVLPPLLCYGLDVTLTLAGQPAPYWAGDRAAVREANPLARWLLACHPAAFALAALGWGLTVAVVLWWRPGRLAVVLAFALTLLHAVGAASWLWPHGLAGKVAALVILALAARLWGA